jgi:hypothetical protein
MIYDTVYSRHPANDAHLSWLLLVLYRVQLRTPPLTPNMDQHQSFRQRCKPPKDKVQQLVASLLSFLLRYLMPIARGASSLHISGV